jgi:catechol 2,3-dioxygenase-like lactoylglutathione lyase family enzyme
MKKIDHVNIVVSDMETSINFYTRLGLHKTLDTMLNGPWIAKVVGLETECVETRCVFMETEGGEARLELIQYLVPNGCKILENRLANTLGIRHFALIVDDLMETYERLMQAGVPFLSEPQEAPVKSGVVSRLGRKRLVYLRDPDDVIVELAEYKTITT